MAGALLDNKIKTYPQHRLVRDLFSLCLSDEASDYGEASEDNITFSRWCNGARPVPVDILNKYKNDTGRNQMITDFENKIIPNLINVSNARYLMEDMINNSRKIIGITKADELTAIDDNATFFTDVMLYAILSDHNIKNLYSPDITDILLSNRLPAVMKEFIGRNDEIKKCGRLLASESVVFINGIAGIGKSELAKYYASRNKKKYINIIYLFYSGSLRKDIAAMEFSDDTSDMDEDALFDSHYQLLHSLHQDSLVILDNFNVLPKEDAFFKEFVKNDFELLVTTRCEIKQYASIKIKEIASEKDLLQLFASHCPYSGNDTETVKQIIREVHSHTLTVVLSALSLAAGGLEPDELLHELKLCGLNITDSEDVELYKDGDYHDGLMIEHLRILMQISRLNASQSDILKDLSILPISGVYKNYFRNWLQLVSLHDINYLARYGFITDDIENKKISLHPLIQEIIYEELKPCISNCQTLVNSLHTISLMHGIEVRKPDNTIQAMISVAENIINDNSACYLLFLQDMFPYLEKYSVRDYMSKLADRISYLMEQKHIDSPCDRALLLDYKAELAYMRKDYDVAVKKREKAIHLLENDTMNTMNQKRYINLLSNLYNKCISCTKKTDKATEALHKSFEIRISYADTGIIETHDTLQQMLNLVNMLILADDLELAQLVLNQYDTLVTANEGNNTLDYGCCRLAAGIITLNEGKPVEAEKNLLAAESIINAAMDTSDSDSASSDTAISSYDNNVSKNDYLKSVYGYLNNLYARWHKPEKALEYKEKWLNARNEQNKNITHRNA